MGPGKPLREFDGVVHEYRAARPGYPAGVFDALHPLKGVLVAEGGAGTGIATQELASRGASVIALDTSISMLRNIDENPDVSPLGLLLADGAHSPIRSTCIDLVCYAQSWHWLDPASRVGEVSRILRPGGRWAGWWSHPRSDDEQWYREIWDLIEASCATADRRHRDIDWSLDFRGRADFEVSDIHVFAWERQLTVRDWITEERSKSYVARLETASRERLLSDIERVLRQQFPSGVARVDYETWLWIAQRH